MPIDITFLFVYTLVILGYVLWQVHMDTTKPGLLLLILALWATPGSYMVWIVVAVAGEIGWDEFWDGINEYPKVLKECYYGK